MKQAARTEDTSQESTPHTYQIGTVATLTGIDPHTIRAWERRYGAIKPTRSESGRRRYDEATVERLQLLKALVDCSEAIGTIAHLPDDELRARLKRIADLERQRPTRGDAAESEPGPARVGLLAPGFAAQVRANAVALSGMEVAFHASDRESLLIEARRVGCDVLLLEADQLEPDAPGFVRACRGLPEKPLVVVLYRFAPRPVLARLARAGAVLIRMPISLAQLRRVCLDQLTIRRARGRHAPRRPAVPVERAGHPEQPGPVPTARRFDDDQLARLFEITTAVECECPNHLSTLVAGLVAFERYSETCESRDDDDAALHGRLARGTGEARARLEQLLAELCEHEGIEV